MTYFVTYCAMDRDTGANILWHSCILLSKENPNQNKLEVVNTWGFYGVPSTENKDDYWTSSVRLLKIKLGLDVDLLGNHGMLRHEETRFLDLGHGLHGMTFELTEDQFNKLEGHCKQMMLDQEKAINDFVEPHHLKGKSPEKTRIYPYEQYSKLIYETECIQAEQEHRPSRLQPFDMHVFDMSSSHTCKTQAISLLKQVLTNEQIARLTEYGKYPSIPRYSGKMEPIFLHSTGPLREHVKRSGDIEPYRDAKDLEVKLFWTIPPQEIDVLNNETKKQFSIHHEHVDEVKVLVKQLQRVEWLFRKNKLPNEVAKYRADLLEKIVQLYSVFSCIKLKEPFYKITGWQGYALGLFSIPRDPVEKKLLDCIDDAKMFLNGLYMAVVDGAEIDHDMPCLELLSAYLPTKSKEQLCAILGRTYCADEVPSLSQ